ncbi:tetratricopeptide repeat protein [Corallococcus sp. CA047B]|uniref:tetratricopeptide repeat protein n=1 Tax=Corallococcus sp. CA047B TaxID=2316729 RepID=UPI0013154E75|nr:tetratricopeptide repeat protein [Corallococcus sp. CA047B]
MVFLDYFLKRADDRRNDEIWLQRIRSLVFQWPAPKTQDIDPYKALNIINSKVAAKYTKPGKRPLYVTRDIDSQIDAISKTHDLILITGNSKSGKSRTAFEAIYRLFPAQSLLVPVDGKALAEIFRLEPPINWGTDLTVIWLDDLQRFLGPGSMTPSLLNQILQTEGRFKIFSTLTSQRHSSYLDSKGDIEKDSQLILKHFQQINLASTLSPEETQRACIAYPEEPPDRLTQSLGEHLVAATELARRLATGVEVNPPGHAIMRAAIDWHRSGILRPIPEPALSMLAAQYLALSNLPHVDFTPAAFEAGLAWAREPVGHHVAMLAATNKPNQARSFAAIDFLVENTEKLGIPIPEHFWEHILTFASHADALSLGRIARRRQDHKFARSTLEFALTSSDAETISTAAFMLGAILQSEKDYSAAEQRYRQAAAVGRGDTADQAMVNLGTILLKRGDLAGAKHAFEQGACSARPDIQRKATANLGLTHLKQGNTADAERIFVEGINSGDSEIIAHSKVNLARVFMDKGQLHEAERILLDIDPAHHEAAAMGAVGLGTINLFRSELEKAETIFREVLKSAQSNANLSDAAIMAESNLGGVLLNLDRIDEAEEIYNRLSFSNEPGVSEMAKVHLGVILVRNDRPTDAEPLFQAGIKASDPSTSALAKANLGSIYKKADPREAERLLREALQSNQPDAIDIANQNLRTLLIQQDRLAEAIQLAEKASLSFQTTTATDAKIDLGILRSIMGDASGAETLLRDAVNSRLPYTSTRAEVNLGAVLAKQGRTQEATRHFRNAIKSGDPHLRSDALALLANMRFNPSLAARRLRKFQRTLESARQWRRIINSQRSSLKTGD